MTWTEIKGEHDRSPEDCVPHLSIRRMTSGSSNAGPSSFQSRARYVASLQLMHGIDRRHVVYVSRTVRQIGPTTTQAASTPVPALNPYLHDQPDTESLSFALLPGCNVQAKGALPGRHRSVCAFIVAQGGVKVINHYRCTLHSIMVQLWASYV